MMNYEIFKEVVKEKFMDYMPDKFKGMELVAEPVEKVNVTLDGIILREEGRNLSLIHILCLHWLEHSLRMEQQHLQPVRRQILRSGMRQSKIPEK